MATNSLALRFKLLGEASGLTKATGKAGKDLSRLGKTTNRISKSMSSSLGLIGAGLSLGGIVTYLKQAAEGAELARQADARVLQVAKSMNLFGANTAETTKRLSKYADSMELTTGQTAEVTKQTQATLLTFAEVGKTADEVGGIFDRATVAAADLAAAGFGTAEGNAVQLGKALNDPIKGLASLSKSGVTFTDAEKERIATLVKSNKIGQAQALVLEAIEKQVGGVAAETALSSVKIQNAFGQVSDQIGEALLPYLDELSKFLTSPKGQAELKKVATSIADLVKEAGKLAKWALENKDLLLTLAGTFAALKIGSGVINSYKTLKTLWEGLVKAGNLIKAPNVGGVGLPQGPVAPGGAAPAVVKGGGVPKGVAPISAAVSVAAAGAVAVGVYGSSMVDLYNTDRKKFGDEVKSQVDRARAQYGNYFSPTEFLLATGKQTGTSTGPIWSQGSNMANVTSKDTYNITLTNPKLTPDQIVAAIKKYNRQRGKSGTGGFVDLG